MIINIGIDIGQKVDPTAICVTEQVWRLPLVEYPGTKMYEDHHLVRHLERLPLATPYPQIVERLAQIVQSVEQRVLASSLENRAGWLVPSDYASVSVWVDATGVGKPVVDMLKAAGVKLTGVYFTHGDRRKEETDEDTGEFRVILGKAYMVALLQALLQTRRMHFPKHGPTAEEVKALAQELLAYEIKVDTNANDRYGAFKVGAHDDLVTALGLSVNKIPAQISMATSSPGVDPQAVPPWAGGPNTIQPGALTGGGPRLAGAPPMPGTLSPWGGLTNWDNAGPSNGIDTIGGLRRLREGRY